MNRFDQSVDLCRRANIPMFLRVLIACAMSDVGLAARYLAASGTPFEVAHRVLLNPNRRRVTRV
jgi:hypothetical protein